MNKLVLGVSAISFLFLLKVGGIALSLCMAYKLWHWQGFLFTLGLVLGK